MKENWKDVPHYEGLYQTSSFGRVRSLNYNHTCKPKILKLNLKSNGYLYVDLCKERKKKTYTVHRLVAIAFIPNPDNLPMINHKDECKTNNIPENLEWCDASYNNSYGSCIKRRAEKRSMCVLQFTLDWKFVREWSSTMECGRNGFHSSAVSKCCRNCYFREGNNIYKGFLWMYADDFFKMLPEI